MSAAQQAPKGVSVGDAMETRFAPVPIDANIGQAVDRLLATAILSRRHVREGGRVARDDILNAG